MRGRTVVVGKSAQQAQEFCAASGGPISKLTEFGRRDVIVITSMGALTLVRGAHLGTAYFLPHWDDAFAYPGGTRFELEFRGATVVDVADQ